MPIQSRTFPYWIYYCFYRKFHGIVVLLLIPYSILQCSEAALGVLTSKTFEMVVVDTPILLNSTELDHVVSRTKIFLDDRLDLSISGYGSSSLVQVVDPIFVIDYQGRRSMSVLKENSDIYTNKTSRGLRMSRTLQNKQFATIFTFRLTATVEASSEEELQQIDFDSAIINSFFSGESDLIALITNSDYVNLNDVHLVQYKLFDESGIPSSAPSVSPTHIPSIFPSSRPTIKPTKHSTTAPSLSPILDQNNPILNPVVSPILMYSNAPSINPSVDRLGSGKLEKSEDEISWLIIAIACGSGVLLFVGIFIIYKYKKSSIQSEKNNIDIEDTQNDNIWSINNTYSSSPPPILKIKSFPVTEDEFTKEWDPADLTFDFNAAEEFRDKNNDIDQLSAENEDQIDELSFTDLPRKDDELDELAAKRKLKEKENMISIDCCSDIQSLVAPVNQGSIDPATDPSITNDQASIPRNTIETSGERSNDPTGSKGPFLAMNYEANDLQLAGAFPRSTPPRENKTFDQDQFATSQFSDESFSHGDTTFSFMHPNDWSNTSYGDDVIYGADDGISKLSKDVQSKFSVNTGGSSGPNHLIKDLVWLEKRIADHKRFSTEDTTSQKSPPSELQLSTILQESNDSGDDDNLTLQHMKSISIRYPDQTRSFPI